MLQKRNTHRMKPAISTASLPDIVFMLLFFFMVVTTMRTNEVKMNLQVPKASQLTKLENKTLVNYIYVGRPAVSNSNPNDSIKIQLGDAYGSLQDIKPFIEAHRANLDQQLHSRIVTSLKVDKDVPMSLIAAIKLELRKANQLKVNYIAERN